MPIILSNHFRKHKDDAPATEEEENDSERKKNQEVPKWDAEFLKVDQGTLFGKVYFPPGSLNLFYSSEIILAANYLDISKLLDYACMTVADQIRGKTPEEIRKVNSFKNNLVLVLPTKQPVFGKILYN